jgi:hypothetical protein
MLLCVTVISVTGTINTNDNDKVFSTSSSNNDIVWIQSNQAVKETASFNVDWIHYDDGTSENGLGLTSGGTLHEAIKLTPTELTGHGPAITSIKVMHGCPLYPGTPASAYTAWIYTGVTAPSNPETGATIVGTGTCPAIDDYYYINLTTPYPFAETDTLWVGVGWVHTAGTFPCGFDTGSCIVGKADWLWYSGGSWLELNGIGYPGNWNLWVGVGAGENQPPVTPNAPAGPTSGSEGVSYSFTASTTDPEGDSISYMFMWDDGTDSGWLGPFASGATATGSHTWTDDGSYDITVKAKDVNNAESGVSPAHTIAISPAGPTLEIANITGGLFKVKTSIKNTGTETVNNINWSIKLDGGLILLGKETTGTITGINAGGSVAISSKMILGFGATTITVTASSISKTQDAKVLLIFVKIL